MSSTTPTSPPRRLSSIPRPPSSPLRPSSPLTPQTPQPSNPSPASSNAPSRRPTPSTPPTKTRARDLLRKHYGLGVGPPPPLPGKSNDPMNLDSPAFDAKAYYEQLITTSSLPVLLKRENEILTGSTTLDLSVLHAPTDVVAYRDPGARKRKTIARIQPSS
ncbi:hypothetical protein AAF712_013025 [Marasmius tenuissimus]|uniref:Uncharacterized protein n=1 Tax=Marasmius tenuissimus TaxID=585030 RepID=A0ABR2ZFW6_9AGAR